jgi:hypothetical protein
LRLFQIRTGRVWARTPARGKLVAGEVQRHRLAYRLLANSGSGLS